MPTLTKRFVVGASRIAATMVAFSLPTMVSAFISRGSGFVRRIPKQVARAKAHMLKPSTSGSIATIGCTPAQSPVGVKSVAIAEGTLHLHFRSWFES